MRASSWEGQLLTRGQRIGRYTVEAYLGSGGMATVYRVRHDGLGSAYALKVLTVPRPDIRARLLREGRFQAGIRHPNVVAVHDVLEVPHSLALLLEYVEGPTLDLWLKRHDPTLDEAESLFRSIVDGVAEAHRRGLVHRDLKPSNVLLARTTSGFVAKVGDFGIAKAVDGNDELATTRTNVAMGTPWYMAPEQIRDAKGVDARADVFSLGCILFELVCGARSFRGADVLSVLNAVVAGNRLDPREYVPTLPDRLLAVIDGCLQVDRERRFPNCEAILTALGDQAGLVRVRTGLDDDPAEWIAEEERVHHATWSGLGDADTAPPDAPSDDEETVPPGGFAGVFYPQAGQHTAEEPTAPPGAPSARFLDPDTAEKAAVITPMGGQARADRPDRRRERRVMLVGILIGLLGGLLLVWGLGRANWGPPVSSDPGVGAVLGR